MFSQQKRGWSCDYGSVVPEPYPQYHTLPCLSICASVCGQQEGGEGQGGEGRGIKTYHGETGEWEGEINVLFIIVV